MELHYTLAVLFCVALIGAVCARESIPDEDYWQAIWPNTPIPSIMKELLKPDAEDPEIGNLPMKIDDTQYPRTFFFEHDLYPGKTMNIKFTKRPFAQPYGVYTWANEVKDIEKEGFTYEDVCVKTPPGKGEHKFCAKSLGTLIGFAISKLGKDIRVLSSSFAGDKQSLYTVEGVQNLGDKAVMCHRLNFRKVVFYCHEIHGTTAYVVPLVASDGTRSEALAVCHHDTSGMNAEILYEVLKIKPGTATACHYLGDKAILWVPNSPVHDDAHNANMAS